MSNDAKDPFYNEKTDEGGLWPITWIVRLNEDDHHIEIWTENTTQLENLADYTRAAYNTNGAWHGRRKKSHLALLDAAASLGDSWINMAFDVMSKKLPDYKYESSSFSNEKQMITFSYHHS